MFVYVVCIWDSIHTVVTKSSPAIISGCLQVNQNKIFAWDKSKTNIFLHPPLWWEMTKWVFQGTTMDIATTDQIYGRKIWSTNSRVNTEKSVKKNTKLTFWKTCHDEFTSCDYHSCFGLDGKGIIWPLRLGSNVFQPSSVGLSNFLITCRSAQTEQRGYKGGVAAENELLCFTIFACH